MRVRPTTPLKVPFAWNFPLASSRSGSDIVPRAQSNSNEAPCCVTSISKIGSAPSANTDLFD